MSQAMRAGAPVIIGVECILSNSLRFGTAAVAPVLRCTTRSRTGAVCSVSGGDLTLGVRQSRRSIDQGFYAGARVECLWVGEKARRGKEKTGGCPPQAFEPLTG